MRICSRRQFAVAGLAWACARVGGSSPVHGESSRKIGMLFAGPSTRLPRLQPFYDRMRELGQVPDRTVQYLVRGADGDYTRLPQLARELVAWGAEVMVCISTPAVLAAMDATRTTPIVMIAVGDAGANRIVSHFAHPEGNVTGPTLLNTPLVWKVMEALHELLPQASRAAVLWNPANPHNEGLLMQLAAAASAVGVQVQPFAIKSPEDLASALKAVSRARAEALVVLPDPIAKALSREILEYANGTGLPSFFTDAEDVASGGLLAYGVSVRDHYRHAADYVERILDGARPRDLPVQQPTQYELTINAATARRLGITIPVLLRVRADRIYQ